MSTTSGHQESGCHCRHNSEWLAHQMSTVHGIDDGLSYTAFLHRTALRIPDKVAVICGDRELTYAQLFAVIDAYASALRSAHGITTGSRVALLLDNSEQYQAWYLAILSMGAVAVPLNTKLTAREIAFQVRDADARLAVSEPKFGEALSQVGVRWFDAGSVPVAKTAASPSSLPKVPHGAPAAIYYTSGTTGNPKGVVQTHRSLIASTFQAAVAWEYNEPSAVTLAMTPLFHIANHAWFLPILSVGGTMVIDTFRTEPILELIVRRRITHLFAVPTMLLLMSHKHREMKQDLSHVKTVSFGAAAMPPEKLSEVKQMVPNAGLVHGMGQTESCGTIVTLPSNFAFEKAGSVGINIDGADVRVVDASDQDVAPGVVGELVTRGANVMREYLGHADATSRALAGGWLHTGDLGYLDEDGFLFLVDRKKDMIIRGGENIYSSEVENVLYMHSDVASVSVVGVKSELFGEEVVAFIVMRDPTKVSAEVLREHCALNLAAFKVPSQFVFLDAMPQTATGKIQKHELRATLAASLAENSR